MNNQLIVPGYVCSLIALFFFPPAFALAALVIGIVNLVRGLVTHGIVQIVLSVVCGLIGVYLGVLVALSTR